MKDAPDADLTDLGRLAERLAREGEGWQVLRVFNVDVFENLNGVLELIGSRLAELQRFHEPTCDPIPGRQE